ncbi:MAG: hypothetical protein K2X38_00185 [Gemmataceae bacterium]|nr:hypothetical protein [Gemmataceae bacterium]
MLSRPYQGGYRPIVAADIDLCNQLQAIGLLEKTGPCEWGPADVRDIQAMIREWEACHWIAPEDYRATAATVVGNCSMIGVHVETTGLRGGDGGHGGMVRLTLADVGNCDLSGKAERGRVTIETTGDAETLALIEALRFAGDRLQRMIDGGHS